MGRTDQVGAANYFLIHRNPIDIAENYTQAFLGLTLTCARCHNHPLEKWTQRDYYQFANLFARVTVKDDDRAFATKSDTALVYSVDRGEILHPRLGVALPPRPLDGVAMKPDTREDRRAYVAAWLTSPSNTQFAHTIVNRVWGSLLGRGLVHPIDDLRATNPASNDELFAALTDDFVSHGFDVKRLIRTTMTSATYQRSAETDDTNVKDDRYYSHHLVRRLPAEVILDAYSQVSCGSDTLRGLPDGDTCVAAARYEDRFVLPDRVRAPGAGADVGGRAADGPYAAAGVARHQRRHAQQEAVRRGRPDRGARARHPRGQRHRRRDLPVGAQSSAGAAERRALVARLDAAPDRRLIVEDLAWAVLTSREFLFTH